MKESYHPNLYTEEEYACRAGRLIEDMEPLVVNGIYLCEIPGIDYESFVLSCHRTPAEEISGLLPANGGAETALCLLEEAGVLNQANRIRSLLDYLFRTESSATDSALDASAEQMQAVRQGRYTPEHLAWKREIRKTKPLF